MHATQLSVQFNKLGADTENVLSRLKGSYYGAPGADCCSCRLLCCLIPVVGWCYWCNAQAEEELDNKKKSVHNMCQQISRELAPKGITVTHVEIDTPGFVFEVQPYLADGSPNPHWTGPHPNLDQATRKALVMDFQAAQGPVLDNELPQYEDVYRQSAAALEQNFARQDALNAMAHKVVMTNWFTALNNAFQPRQQQEDAAFRAALQAGQINGEPLMKKALEDLGSYQQMEPTKCAMYVNNPAALDLNTAIMEFLQACAMDPPPPYNPNAPSAVYAPAPEMKGAVAYQQAPPSYQAAPEGMYAPAPSAPAFQAESTQAPLLGQQPPYNSNPY
jgi:hypothetical protein